MNRQIPIWVIVVIMLIIPGGAAALGTFLGGVFDGAMAAFNNMGL